MKKPVPHSNPARPGELRDDLEMPVEVVERRALSGALWSMRLYGRIAEGPAHALQGSRPRSLRQRQESPPRASPRSSIGARWAGSTSRTGTRGANGARAMKPSCSSTTRSPPRHSWRTMSHQMHRCLIRKCWSPPASSSSTIIGTIGVAMSWECVCSSDGPAGSPMVLEDHDVLEDGDPWRDRGFARGRRGAPRRDGSPAAASILASWSGASMTTSWAPTPLIRS